MDDILWKPRTPVLQNIDGYEKTRHFFKNMTFRKSGRHYQALFPKIKIFVGGGRFPENPGSHFPKNFLGEK